MTPADGAGACGSTSSSGAPGSLIPSDLRIGFPQVEGDHVGQPVEFFPDEPRDGKLDQRRGLRVRRARRSRTRPGRPPPRAPGGTGGAVADQQDVLPLRLGARPPGGPGGATRNSARAQHACRGPAGTGSRRPPRAARRSRRRSAGRCAGPPRRARRARHPDDRHPPGLGERLRRLDADPEAGEQARADPDRDAADLWKSSPGPARAGAPAAGTTSSWRVRPRDELLEARMPRSVPSATVVCGVEVSIAEDDHARSLAAGPIAATAHGSRAAASPPRVPPRRALRAEHRRRSSGASSSGVVSSSSRWSSGSSALDRVAPLDHEHARPGRAAPRTRGRSTSWTRSSR